MKSQFGNVMLSAWGGFGVCSQIDETEKDIEKLIIYQDHGDDYLIVKTKDGKTYEYGYYLNLKYGPPGLIRPTVLFRKEDDHSEISNEIYFSIYGSYYNEGFMDRSGFRVIKDSESAAKWKFDMFAIKMKAIYNKGIMYHCNKCKPIVLNYLEVNKIATEENLKKLEEIIFDTSYYGIDGIAGKRDRSGQDIIHGDCIKYAYSDGKQIQLKRHRDSYDEWGVCSYWWRI